MDKKIDLEEFISTLKNKQIIEENVSGPCRDRTDDPQIKSSSSAGLSNPE